MRNFLCRLLLLSLVLQGVTAPSVGYAEHELPDFRLASLLFQVPQKVTSSFTNTLSTQFTNAAQNSVSFGNNCDQAGGGSFTISMWIKSNDLIHGAPIFTTYTAGSGKGYELQLVTAGDIDWSMNNGASFMEVHTAASGVSNGAWHHIAIVATGSTVSTQTVYIDGASKTLTNISNTFSGSMSNANNCVTGWRPSIGGDIQVNQISYWGSTALTSGNMTSLYNSGTSAPNVATLGISGLTHYWYMGSGDNATSAGGFVDHQGSASGTGSNTPVFVSDVPH